MKKTIFAVVLLVLSLSLIDASSLSQQLYDATDREYIETTMLCQASGVLGPSTVTPITGEELIIALDRIDKNTLSDRQKSIYESLYATLGSYYEKASLEFFTDISPTVFLTDRYEGNFSRDDYYAIDYKDERPGVDIGAVATYGKNIVIEGSYPLINTELKNKGVYLTSLDWLINFRNGTVNTFGGKDKSMMNRDQLPDNARGSIGNEYINLAFGRTKHNMGSGFTGNLLIGDNFRYQEVAKFTLMGNWMTYNISLTHFDQQLGKDQMQYPAFGGMHQTRVVHRMDINIKNVARVAVNLGTLYQADTAFDIRFLTPFIISHHYYNFADSQIINDNPIVKDEANNIFGIEIEVSPIKNLKITMQGVLDQFQLPTENQDALPMAMGGLINASYAFYKDDYRLSMWAEGVYTMPYLYLNFKKDKVETIKDGNIVVSYVPNYNYDFIFGYTRRENWNKDLDDIAFSGYPSGPDTIVAALGFDYMNYDINLRLFGFLKYQAHGEQGFNTDSFEGFQDKKTPSGVPETMIAAHLGFSWQALPNLEAFGGAQLTCFKNFGNIEGEKLNKMQGYIGFTWRYSSLSK